MDEVIHELDPSATALTALLMKLRKETTFSPKYEFLEDEYSPKEDAINNGAGYAAGVTTFTVDNGNYFRPYDIIICVRTTETMLVTANTATTIDVTRSWGTVAAAALVDDDPLWIIGNANAEGAGAPEMRTTKIVPKFNYTQIFREPVQVTRTENDSKLYGGKDLARLRRKHGVEHMMQMERAAWFGEKAEDNSGATPRRTTEGILPALETAGSGAVLTDLAGAALTANAIDTWTQDLFRYGSSTKFLFCSRMALTSISRLAKTEGVLQMFPSDQVYGMAIWTWVSPHGVLKVVLNNLFTETETDGRYSGWMVGLDLADISWVVFNNADTKLLLGRQDNDVDGEIDEYLTEAGLKLIHTRQHGALYDFIVAA
jgi:hypothetical protein